MKLTLDHTQRLNLHALLGAQRADVGSIRAIWAIQDRIALDADEEKAVELKREMVARPGARGVEPRALDPGQGVRVLRSGGRAHQGGDPDVGLVRRQCRPALAPTTGRGAVLDRTRRSDTSHIACGDGMSARVFLS